MDPYIGHILPLRSIQRTFLAHFSPAIVKYLLKDVPKPCEHTHSLYGHVICEIVNEYIHQYIHTDYCTLANLQSMCEFYLSFFLKLYVSSILIKKTICDLIYQESIYISTDRIPTLVVWILKLMKYYYLDLNGKALIQNTRLLNV